VERYEQAVRLAARFVMQLQLRLPECYYVGLTDEVVGGVRRSLWDHRLRVDDSAAALWGLTRAREELFGPLPPRNESPSTQPAAEKPKRKAAEKPKRGNATPSGQRRRGSP
jgi:hypothetical protein